MKQWGLTDEEQKQLDDLILAESDEALLNVPDDWKRIVLAAPPDFFPIMRETIKAYQSIRETDKLFPAIEAIFIEARNSLPQEILDTISKEKG